MRDMGQPGYQKRKLVQDMSAEQIALLRKVAGRLREYDGLFAVSLNEESVELDSMTVKAAMAAGLIVGAYVIDGKGDALCADPEDIFLAAAKEMASVYVSVTPCRARGGDDGGEDS